MTEVKLNDECMHCNNRECHDGEHFCNQAMKDNSFYKIARQFNINQKLVAKLFMETMQTILSEVEK